MPLALDPRTELPSVSVAGIVVWLLASMMCTVDDRGDNRGDDRGRHTATVVSGTAYRLILLILEVLRALA